MKEVLLKSTYTIFHLHEVVEQKKLYVMKKSEQWSFLGAWGGSDWEGT